MHCAMAEMVAQRGLVELAGHQARGQQGAQLAGEQQAALLLMIVQRFHAEAVACDHEDFLLHVPHRKGEHALQPVQAILAPFHPGRQQHLGVALGPEDMLRQAFAQLPEIVHGPVVDQHITAVRADEGLIARRPAVDDAEAAMPEHHAASTPAPFGIGPTMGQCIGHPRHYRVQVRRPRSFDVPCRDACNAAHGVLFSRG